MPYLIALFIGVPLIELALLIQVGQWMGVMPTILLVVATGVGGAALAKSQGLQIMGQIQKELAVGQVPSESLMDGVMVLIGGFLLLTPGILTDLLGFCLLFPLTRVLMKKYLRDYLSRRFAQGRVIRINYWNS